MFVVPALAATNRGRRPARSSASIARSRESGRMRNRSSTGTARTRLGGNPSTRAALATEEWAWSEWYTTASAHIEPSRASLAHASAVRFATEPPLTRRPPA